MARTRFKVKEGISIADDISEGGYPLVPVGTVVAFAGSSAPEGWLLCDGSAVSRTTYANLWATISSTYGSGNGSTTFNLPDAMGRTLIGAGSGAGLTTRTISTKSGGETSTIGTSNLPPHTHGLNNHTHTLGGHTHTTTIDPPATGSGGISANHIHGTDSQGTHEHRLYFVIDAGSGTARARVSASGTSLSNTGITTFEGGHGHNLGGVSSDHGHTTDIAPFNATSGGPSTDSGGASGNTTDGGFANTGLSVMPPFLVLNYIIKY